MQPTLFLIPTPLGSPDTPCLLPHEQKLLTGLTDFVVEGEKVARACLRHFGLNAPLQELSLRTLNKHTEPAELPDLLQVFSLCVWTGCVSALRSVISTFSLSTISLPSV